MTKEKVASSGAGVGLGGLIFIVFLILKLGEIGIVNNWSWWWVTSPLWIPWVLILGFVSVFTIIAIIVAVIASLVSK